MGWFGTIIGSSLGFVLGGPLGAIGGAALGHLLLDRAPRQHFSASSFDSKHIHSREARQAGYFLALFSIMGKIAAADGKISESERQMVRQFIRRPGIDQKQGEYALRIFEEAARSPHTARELAQQFYLLTPGQTKYHLNFMDLLVRLATADGVLSESERQMLSEVAGELYISEEDVRLLLSRTTHTWQGRGNTGAGARGGSVAEAYHTLGCTPQSHDSEVRSAYRRLASAYHPDKVISKDLPEEFTQLAKEKFQEIQAAYQTVKAARGL